MTVSKAVGRLVLGVSVAAGIWACGAGMQPGGMPASALNPTTVGDLTKPLDQMSRADLWKEARHLKWISVRKQDRQCERGECRGRISAVRDQEPPGPAVIGQHGTIVARLENHGGGWLGWDRGAESKYGTRKGDQWTLIIAIQDGSAWKWVVAIARAAGTEAARVTEPAAWAVCDTTVADPNHPPAGTRALFYRCLATVGNGDSSPSTASGGLTDPGWLNCDQGCCTAGS